MNQGISTLHGPHQVAQKFRRTTLPRRSDSLTVLPAASLSAKSGAAIRSFSGFVAAATFEFEQPVNATQARTTTATELFRKLNAFIVSRMPRRTGFIPSVLII